MNSWVRIGKEFFNFSRVTRFWWDKGKLFIEMSEMKDVYRVIDPEKKCFYKVCNALNFSWEEE